MKFGKKMGYAVCLGVFIGSCLTQFRHDPSLYTPFFNIIAMAIGVLMIWINDEKWYKP